MGRKPPSLAQYTDVSIGINAIRTSISYLYHLRRNCSQGDLGLRLTKIEAHVKSKIALYRQVAPKNLAKSSPISSPAPKPLRESTKGGLGPRPITNESIVQSSHVPGLQPRTAPNRSPVQSRSKLPPKPTTSESNTGKSAAVETPNQAEFPPSDIISKGVGNVPVSDDHTQARTAIHNSKLGLSVDTEMEEANGDGDPDKEKQSPTHAGDGDDEYFEVEAIKSCKLSSRVRGFSTFFIFILTI